MYKALAIFCVLEEIIFLEFLFTARLRKPGAV